ncbi:MAG: hypothetical protein AAFN74_02910 [Myxococcota bacterium]
MKWLCGWLPLLVLGAAAACGGDGGDDDPSSLSSSARFTYDCDLFGLVGKLTINVEAINAAGVVFGPGPTPDITAVIATGDVTLRTAGDLRSDVAYYTFTGRDSFADFTEASTFERFRVQWIVNGTQLTMVINPFGSIPTRQLCQQTSAVRL